VFFAFNNSESVWRKSEEAVKNTYFGKMEQCMRSKSVLKGVNGAT
jgi:hypothetical protein